MSSTAPKPPPTPTPGGPLKIFRRQPKEALPRQGSLRWSFTWAFEGIVYVLRTQRNMRIHFAAGGFALVLALVLGVTRLEFIAVLGAVSLVLIAEMVNTAIEAAIDALVTHYHPLVKVAKDVSAGAVLFATANALAVAYLVFYSHLTDPTQDLVGELKGRPSQIVVGSLIVTIILAIAIKAAVGRGTPLRGGLPSGHAAAAFAGWAAITVVAHDVAHAALVSTMAFMMALLVAQSRVEAGIHSAVEVIAGAVLGTAVTILMFQVLG
jgi:diacylglycerol kinase (ATP)